jgi:hypothetical protein
MGLNVRLYSRQVGPSPECLILRGEIDDSTAPIYLRDAVGLFFSQLNRKLAIGLTCQKLAEAVRGDDALVNDIIAACQLEAATIQRPDPGGARPSFRGPSATCRSRPISHGGIVL